MTTPISGPAIAIIVAAGKSERMGGRNKVFAELLGRPLIAWTLRAFKACAAIDGIVVVAAPDAVGRMAALVREWRFDTHVRAVVAGGDTRQDSVRAGLDACPDAAIVAVHDGARPLVTSEIIERGVALARERRAALCAVPARDTIKQVGEAMLVTATLPRDSMWLAQTPQCFERALLLDAHTRAQDSATDDAALVEAAGCAVPVYEGDASNFKVTAADDLVIAEALLRERLGS